MTVQDAADAPRPVRRPDRHSAAGKPLINANLGICREIALSGAFTPKRSPGLNCIGRVPGEGDDARRRRHHQLCAPLARQGPARGPGCAYSRAARTPLAGHGPEAGVRVRAAGDVREERAVGPRHHSAARRHLLARLHVLGARGAGLGVAGGRHLHEARHDRRLPQVPGAAARRGARRHLARHVRVARARHRRRLGRHGGRGARSRRTPSATSSS